ncbi:hypothetical protein LZ554_003937 [Drepanopeziza brunnea f. sp. 'monogermtubi']|nr:hypothetical protein LZ554_003937 [Drepanopeziza brunnea f. sp. 'monogermtubi']
MVSLRPLVLAYAAAAGLASAAPSISNLAKRPASFVPGTVNNTREFYIAMVVTEGHFLTKYNGQQIEAYHTGAGLADPVFKVAGTPAYLNNTQLQFDANAYPFSLVASAGDTNYARWEPTSIGISYGSTGFANAGSKGIIINSTEFGGWLVCEWFHGANLPQLFQLIKGFNAPGDVYPASCARVKLIPKWI